MFGYDDFFLKEFVQKIFAIIKFVIISGLHELCESISSKFLLQKMIFHMIRFCDLFGLQ